MLSFKTFHGYPQQLKTQMEFACLMLLHGILKTLILKYFSMRHLWPWAFIVPNTQWVSFHPFQPVQTTPSSFKNPFAYLRQLPGHSLLIQDQSVYFFGQTHYMLSIYSNN